MVQFCVVEEMFMYSFLSQVDKRKWMGMQKDDSDIKERRHEI